MSDPLFKKPDGSFVRVAPQYAEAAARKGYVLSDETQLEASRQTGRAFLEGAARGATLGISDQMLVGWGVKPAEMKARKEENPIAAGGGEIVGALGTSIATGGGASALVGGGIKGAAFEGGLYGMGSMVTESALENRDVATDSLASGFLGGALASGGVAAAFKGVGKGVSLATSKFGGQGLKDVARQAADDIEWKALEKNVSAGWLERNAAFKPEILKAGRDAGVLGKFGAAFDDEGAKRASDYAKSFATKISGQMDDLERLVPLKGNDKLRMQLVNYLEQHLDDEFGMNPVFNEQVGAMKKLTDAIANEPAHTWNSVWDVQSALFKDTNVTTLSPAMAQARESLRGAMRDFVFDEVAGKAPGLPAGLAASMRKTGSDARAAMALSSAFAKRARALDKSSIFGMDSAAIGGLGGFATGSPLGAIAASVAKKQVERRGALFSAAALRSMADSNVTNGVSKALAGHLNTVLNTAPELLGAYRYPLAVAAAQGADALAQEHLRLASSDVGQDYLARTGLPAETPEEVDAAGAKLAVLDAIDQQARAHQADLDSAVDGLFGSAPGRKAGVSAPMTPKEFSKAFAQIQSFIQSPETAFEQIPPEMRAAAPAATGEAVQKMLMAAQFLYSKAPKSPYAGMPAAIAPKWEPDAVSLDRFYRYKEAVEQPARVLKNMSQGYISPEQVEALKAVYPSMYAELQQKIGERLMTLKSPPTYQQRLAFSALLGPGALGMSPQQVQILQQTQGLASQAQRGQGGGVKPPDGRQDVNEDQMETEAQKLEAR